MTVLWKLSLLQGGCEPGRHVYLYSDRCLALFDLFWTGKLVNLGRVRVDVLLFKGEPHELLGDGVLAQTVHHKA